MSPFRNSREGSRPKTESTGSAVHPERVGQLFVATDCRPYHRKCLPGEVLARLLLVEHINLVPVRLAEDGLPTMDASGEEIILTGEGYEAFYSEPGRTIFTSALALPPGSSELQDITGRRMNIRFPHDGDRLVYEGVSRIAAYAGITAAGLVDEQSLLLHVGVPRYQY
jgi:hypothetical protein